MKIFITGGPKTGKTTAAKRLSKDLSIPVLHTDDYRNLGWSHQSSQVALQMSRTDSIIIEGTTVPRALRKWLLANPTGSPCDRLMILDLPVGARTKGMESMAKGVDSVLLEIIPELLRRGVVIIRG